MATFFRNATENAIGPVEVLVASSGSSARFTVIGMSLTNLTESVVLATIRLEKASTSTYFIKEVIIPPNQSLRVINGGEKLIVDSSTDIYVKSNTDSSLDLIMSYVEIV